MLQIKDDLIGIAQQLKYFLYERINNIYNSRALSL